MNFYIIEIVLNISVISNKYSAYIYIIDFDIFMGNSLISFYQYLSYDCDFDNDIRMCCIGMSCWKFNSVYA